jgi:hypothetical protein
LSDFDFSTDDSSSSKENEKVKRKQGDFISLCLMGKFGRMSPDLPRGTGKLIGGDLNIDDEGFEQCWFEPV